MPVFSPADVHESSPLFLFEKQNVFEKHSSDLATLEADNVTFATMNVTNYKKDKPTSVLKKSISTKTCFAGHTP